MLYSASSHTEYGPWHNSPTYSIKCLLGSRRGGLASLNLKKIKIHMGRMKHGHTIKWMSFGNIMLSERGQGGRTIV